MAALERYKTFEPSKSVAIITNIAPLYREALWTVLLHNDRYRFHFFFGNREAYGIKGIDFNQEKFKLHLNQLHPVKNHYGSGKRLVWQSGVFKGLSKTKTRTLILLGDMWVPSNWLLAIIGRLKKQKVVFWSHGIYGNESFFKKKMRILFYKLAHKHLLYERRGKRLMVRHGFRADKLHVVFNSLNYKTQLEHRKSSLTPTKKQLFPFFKNPELPVLLFVGRLTKIKKIDLLLEASKRINKSGYRVNTLIIGDGPQKEYLLTFAEEDISNQITHFYGACYSENDLSKMIANADFCVSPGNVGLTAIHSLSYGTPVCTHGNFANQMPEVEAIIEGYNGMFFEEENVHSLVERIEKWIFGNELTREEIRANCYNIIDAYYNPSYQCKVIENLLDGGKPFI